MAAPDNSAHASEARGLRWSRIEHDLREPSLELTIVLGLLATVLVGGSVTTAFELGYPAVGLGFLWAVGLFAATLVAYEAARRFTAGAH